MSEEDLETMQKTIIKLKKDVIETEKDLEIMLGKQKEGYLKGILKELIDIRLLVDYLIKEKE